MKLNQEQRDAIMMDPRYQNIGDLPSGSVPYTWTDLYIRPFEVPELKLISRAASQQDVQHVIRAIDLCISEDVYELSIGDYFYILMWQKLHSYTKTPLIVEWPCPADVLHRLRDGLVQTTELTDAQIAEAAESGKEEADQWKVEPCGTLNSEPIHMVGLEIVTLEDGFKLPEGLDFPRVNSMASISELLADPDLQFLIPAIQWMPGSNAKEKMDHFESTNDMGLFRKALAANENVKHGVVQKTTLTCRRCRSRFEYVIPLDPMSFFQ